MAANDASGVGNASGVRSSLGELDALFTAVKRGEKELKSAKEAEAALVKGLQTHTAEANKSATASMKLANAVRELKVGSEASREGAKSLAAELSGSVGIMTTAQAQNREAYRKSLETIIAQTQALEKSKESNRDVAILAREKANVEMEIMEDTIKEQRSMVAAHAASGKTGSAIWSAAQANLMSTGATIGKLGQYVGATGTQMASMAAWGGAATMAILALNAAWKQSAENARSASAAGLQLDSITSDVGDTFARAAQAQAMAMGFGVKSIDIQNALADSMQNYGFGLLATGKAYSQSIKGSVEDRNALITSGTKFVTEAGAIGISLGLSLQEGAAFATKLGVLAKSGYKDTLTAYSYMATEAKKLGVPLNAVSGIFEVLANNADHLGSTATKLTGQTFELMNMMVEFGEKGVKGFDKNMDPEKMQRMAKNFAGLLAGMDEVRMAAIMQKPGQNAFEALASVEGLQMEGRGNVIRTLAERYRINTNLEGPNKARYEDFLRLGAMAGTQGSPTDKVMAGRFYAGVVNKKDFGMGDLLEAQAKQIQSKYDATQTFGRQLAQGADPLGIIANIASELLKVVIGIAKSPVLNAFGGKPNQAVADYERSSGKAAKSTYSAGLEAKRNTRLAGKA